MQKSKVKYGDQKAHAVTAALKLFTHDHVKTLLIYMHIYICYMYVCMYVCTCVYTQPLLK